MSTMTATPARTTEHPKLTFGTTMKSEWLKLVTVRSTAYSALALVVLSVGMVALVAASTGVAAPGKVLGADYAGSVLGSGVSFSQLVMAVFAVLLVCNEYSTGLVQATFAANPRRLSVLAAKAIVAVVTAIVLGTVCWLLSCLVALPMLQSQDIHASITDGPVIAALGTVVVYLAVVSLFAVFVGTIVRNTAASIAIVVAIVFVLPIVAGILSAFDVASYLLASANQTLAIAIGGGVDAADITKAAVVVAVWLVASGTGAVVSLTRRDA